MLRLFCVRVRLDWYTYCINRLRPHRTANAMAINNICQPPASQSVGPPIYIWPKSSSAINSAHMLRARARPSVRASRVRFWWVLRPGRWFWVSAGPPAMRDLSGLMFVWRQSRDVPPRQFCVAPRTGTTAAPTNADQQKKSPHGRADILYISPVANWCATAHRASPR